MSTPPFPLYRKLRDGRRWYRVEAPDRMTEVERIGERYLRHALVAVHYPERLRVAEVMGPADDRYAECPEAEFMAVLDRSSAGPDR